jgi:hypothetical protein
MITTPPTSGTGVRCDPMTALARCISFEITCRVVTVGKPNRVAPGATVQSTARQLAITPRRVATSRGSPLREQIAVTRPPAITVTAIGTMTACPNPL